MNTATAIKQPSAEIYDPPNFDFDIQNDAEMFVLLAKLDVKSIRIDLREAPFDSVEADETTITMTDGRTENSLEYFALDYFKEEGLPSKITSGLVYELIAYIENAWDKKVGHPVKIDWEMPCFVVFDVPHRTIRLKVRASVMTEIDRTWNADEDKPIA